MLICQDYDNTIRWQPGERMHHLYEFKCDALESAGKGDHPAAIAEGIQVSYRELDNRANQLARYLHGAGIKPGDRIGLLLGKSVTTYVALLAVLKVGAAYVPLDASFPAERIAYILRDSEAKAIVTISGYVAGVEAMDCRKIILDEITSDIEAHTTERLSEAELGPTEDQLAYIIYTSGSTGYPKGVAIDHPSICNFLKVAAEVYGYKEEDRVYQGMTIAFDFSVEELWVPLVAGATLVPGRADTNLLGQDLADYLLENKVTAICCVPTLLASIDVDIPDLRFILVSGEACPQDLVARWSKPGRTFINAYGPTEATVTCTWTDLAPGKPVTIGGPLPTYSMLILEEDQPKEVADGGTGEVCVAGIGLARGYVNRDDLTEKAFIPDVLDLPDNPSGRIYRTGDLGRITESGEIEFLGRIDTQLKVRGYRIELTEIESVFMEMPDVAQAVVDTCDVGSGAKELVAYYTSREGAGELASDELSALLRSRLPAYMIPAFVEKLPHIPMLPSHKADRKSLPAPAGPRFVVKGGEIVAPRNDTERAVAEALEAVLESGDVSVEDNFFNDLGAHSMLMAQMAQALREKMPQVSISMRDIYLNPTVAELAALIDMSTAGDAKSSSAAQTHVASDAQYMLCGALQLGYQVLFAALQFAVAIGGIHWALKATGAVDLYLRFTSFGIAAFLFFSAIPIAAKWLMIGRFKAEAIPIWSLAYFRFWLVKTLMQSSPAMMFGGSPLYNVYLRLLGARIGKNVVIRVKHLPACPDLLSIGANSILRKDSVLNGYKAEAGMIRTGPVTLGQNIFVGEASVIDINTSMGDDCQIGHSSTLLEGQDLQGGAVFHGSPAQQTSGDYNTVPALPMTTRRKVIYSSIQLALGFLLVVPVAGFLLYAFAPQLFGQDRSIWTAAQAVTPIGWTLTAFILAASLILFLSALLTGLIAIALLPRLANHYLEEGRVYPLYGIHYVLQGWVSGLSNSKYYNVLFGDSSFIVYYLQCIGIDMSKIVQTGSNFGTNQKHDNPFMCKIGTGTMVSDGLSLINTDMSNSSFRLKRTVIGDNNFFGNNVHYPAGGRTGENVLFATKVMVPLDGPVRENVGLLGSPSFEIPRSVERDLKLNEFADEAAREAQLRAKNLSNIATVASFLFFQWLYGALLLIFTYALLSNINVLGLGVVALGMVVAAGFSIGYFVFVERLSLGFGRLKPMECAVLDAPFWKIEHHWKLAEHPLMGLFRGTPFKNIISRALGIRMGRKVFDDGAIVTEKTLLEVGDYCTLNEGATLQAHSLEDAAFKSDWIVLGKGCTVGTNGYVHYGVTMGDHTVLAPDAFLMKGQTLPSGSIWQGNPASPV